MLNSQKGSVTNLLHERARDPRYAQLKLDQWRLTAEQSSVPLKVCKLTQISCLCRHQQSVPASYRWRSWATQAVSSS